MNILDFLFPRRCVNCAKFGKYICSRCGSMIQFIETKVCPVCERPAIGGATHPRCQTKYSLDGLTSIFVYGGPVKKAIKQLKYQLVTDLAKEIISLADTTSMYRYIRVVNLADFVLAPVPLHWWRKAWRGFNQAEILGRLISTRLGIRFIPNLLVREKFTRPQVELKGKQRQENIQDAFRLSLKIHHPPSKILLFDDVWTTGATLRSCGNILKRAGVKRVWGLTLAK